jgi:hypothetical protein
MVATVQSRAGGTRRTILALALMENISIPPPRTLACIDREEYCPPRGRFEIHPCPGLESANLSNLTAPFFMGQTKL